MFHVLAYPMSTGFVDLHCHSTASDGTLTPAEVVQLAHRCGLVGLALTDHDTAAGCAEARAEAAKRGIEFLAGIEISAEFPYPGTMHILGYGIDPSGRQLADLTDRLLAGREDRNPRIVAKLNELGVSVSMEEWQREAAGGVPGRPHLAAVLVRKGYVSSIKQAFDKYLGQGAAAYFDKERLAPRQAIERIIASGGIAVLAHPVQLRPENDLHLERIVRDLVDMGLGGIEVLHSDHDESWISRCTRLAERFGLLKTGGSDFHGTNKEVALGQAGRQRVPRQFLDDLAQALRRT